MSVRKEVTGIVIHVKRVARALRSRLCSLTRFAVTLNVRVAQTDITFSESDGVFSFAIKGIQTLTCPLSFT